MASSSAFSKNDKVNSPEIRKPLLDAGQFVSAAIVGDLQGLFAALVPHGLDSYLQSISLVDGGESILDALKSPSLPDRISGVQKLSHLFQTSGDAITAAALTSVLLEEVMQAFEDGRLSDSTLDALISSMMFTNVLTTTMNVGLDSGMHTPFLGRVNGWFRFPEKLIGQFEKGGQDHSRLVEAGQGTIADYVVQNLQNSLNGLCIFQAQAFILAGEYEQAAETIQRVPPELELPDHLRPGLVNVMISLDNLLRRPDQLARPPTVNKEEQRRKAVKMFSELHGVEIPNTDDAFEQVLRIQGLPIAPDQVEDLAAMAEALHNAGFPTHALSALTARIAEVYHPEAAITPAQLEVFARTTELAAMYAEQIDSWADMIRQHWLHCHFLKRLGRIKDAANHLRKVRDAIERRRLKIRDPRLRAGLSAFLEHLPGLSAEVIMKLGEDRAELFAIIEGAKSRILADLVEAKSSPQPEDVSPEELREREARLLGRMRDLLVQSRQRAHYVSYLVDDDMTFCILLDSSGNLHAHSVPLGKSIIEAAAKHLKELVQGSRSVSSLASRISHVDPWQRPFEPVISLLSPLADIVTALRGSGVIRDGDVLCYAPDSAIFNIPLQMLESAGKALGEILTITCTPSAQVLLTMADNRAMPQWAIAVAAPRNAEEEADSQSVSDCVKRFIPTYAMKCDHTLKARLRAVDKKHAVITFSMHGDFKAKHPLEKSGLLLSGPGSEDILTPHDFADMDLSGSHVTLRACVSGLVTQITSREALGCIWAILQAGATSIFASAWQVNSPSSSQYIEIFYEEWLSGGQKGLSHKKAMESLKNKGGALAHPYHWSPFILYGYWE